MRRWIYRGWQQVTDERNQKIRLEYYLEEDVREVRVNTCLYGIGIVMCRELNGETITEKGHAPAISCSREFVELLLEKLKRMSVTPTSLPEVVDDEVYAVQTG